MLGCVEYLILDALLETMFALYAMHESLSVCYRESTFQS
jgi:hypothetical protein